MPVDDRTGNLWKLLKALMLLVALALLAYAFFAPPMRPGSRTRAFLGIVNTLRQIEGAKGQYAVVHNLSSGSVVSREQLFEYFPEKFWNSHAEYQINVIGKDPEAVLPLRFDGLPAKTIIRLSNNTNTNYQIVRP